MTTWYEKFEFVSDPYSYLDPYKIDFKLIKWNRDDMYNERLRLNQFLDDVKEGKRASLQVYGALRSGKTWLTRLIEKEIVEKFDNDSDKIAFIYTKVTKTDPTFKTVFRLAITDFLEKTLDRLAKKLQEPKLLPDWEKVFSNQDFAKCCRNYFNNRDILTKRWLTGEKLTSSELGKLPVNSSISEDYDRYVMLQSLCADLSKMFSTTVLVVDELENAEVKLASQLSDILRELLDQLSEKFVLICTLSAQREDEWYDVGYTEALLARIVNTIQIKNLDKETLPNLLREHHKLYRKEEYAKDQLWPFDESGIRELYDQMPAGRRAPGYFFPNCQDIVRLADSAGQQIIDSQFVYANFAKLAFHK